MRCFEPEIVGGLYGRIKERVWSDTVVFYSLIDRISISSFKGCIGRYHWLPPTGGFVTNHQRAHSMRRMGYVKCFWARPVRFGLFPHPNVVLLWDTQYACHIVNRSIRQSTPHSLSNTPTSVIHLYPKSNFRNRAGPQEYACSSSIYGPESEACFRFYVEHASVVDTGAGPSGSTSWWSIHALKVYLLQIGTRVENAGPSLAISAQGWRPASVSRQLAFTENLGVTLTSFRTPSLTGICRPGQVLICTTNLICNYVIRS